jgi:hypothetical protein
LPDFIPRLDVPETTDEVEVKQSIARRGNYMPSLGCVLACAATALELIEFIPAYAVAAAWCVENFCED